ncbi:hypothetical protein DSC45_05385 [Streptomyces sp. YIM 130001]|nr:hypothetical protein DSC45_05385 [Streptomyces sp. YIM 130001]
MPDGRTVAELPVSTEKLELDVIHVKVPLQIFR